LDYSSDFLDEFHGFTDEEDHNDGFNEKIDAGEVVDEGYFQDEEAKVEEIAH
jgi:hypothetical protein